MDWVIEEFATLSLGDKRLDKRAKQMLAKLSQNVTESIPVACRGAAETKAAYRFFDNDHVTPEKIHATHFEATIARMEKKSIVLLPQDTTALNFSGQYQRKDTGPTTQDSTKGMHVHCTLAVTPEKVCLGMTSCKQWHREALQKLTKRERTKKNYLTPIEGKESYRWLENYRLANEYAIALPNTMIVSMADREGDIYDIFEEAHQVFSHEEAKAHYLIRAKTDRAVCDAEGKITGDKIKLTLKNEKLLGELTIHVSETKKRKAREAKMEVYSKAIHIAPPNK